MKPQIKKEVQAFMGKTRSRFFKYFGKMTAFLSRKKYRNATDKNLVYALASNKIPTSDQIKHLNKTLSKKEGLIIKIALVIVLINGVYLGIRFYNKHIITVPLVGGTYHEGLLGYPKNINPLYSSSRDVDQDVAALIYSSLFKHDENGQLIGDLAQQIETSDNKTFVITLKDGVKWHSGEILTADDVIFTFNLINNSDYNSPLRKNFTSVSIEKISNNQIKFTLPAAYAAFPNLLTFGIMPQSVWENVSPDAASLTELNLKPIGSGPYKFSSLLKSKQGELKEYRLVLNEDYYGNKPYIENIVFKFYPDENELISALNDGDVSGISYLPISQKHSLLAQNSLNFYSLSSSEEDLIFFRTDVNKNLSDIKVRQALALAIDKNSLVKELFNDFYKIVDGPLSISSFAYNNQITKYNYDAVAANAKLDAAGWQRIIVSAENLNSESAEVKAIIAYASSTQEKPEGAWRFKKDAKGNVELLTIKLSAVSDTDSLIVANRVKVYWDAIGAHTTVNSISSSEITNLISSRNFEALLFGELLGSDPDIFAFWHSSQSDGNGLNITGYKNDKVDKFLEDARVELDKNSRINNYKETQRIIADELPAIFLYEKNYVYVQSKKIKGFHSTAAITPSDRFSGISSWFLKSYNKFSW